MQKILTWRWKEEPAEEKPADGDKPAGSPRKRPPRQREYFVKHHGKSYWHCEWVSELQACDSPGPGGEGGGSGCSTADGEQLCRSRLSPRWMFTLVHFVRGGGTITRVTSAGVV